MKLKEIQIEELLQQPESTWLDFKREWHANNAELVHDIFCLANSDSNCDKYIVVGFDEKTKTFNNLSTDENRKNEEQLIDLIKNSNFNCKPIIKVTTVDYQNNVLDIIQIENAHNKPYFLKKDKQEGKIIIRAGVVYTRDASTNTPKNSTASEYQIAKMWQERFGLLLSPKERIYKYLEDIENWECQGNDENSTMIFYYKQFPEFTMEYKIPKNIREYSNSPERGNYLWMHSIGNSYETKLLLKYHTTILETKILALCDKARYSILPPKIAELFYNPADCTDFHLFTAGATISDNNLPLRDFSDKETYTHYRRLLFFYNIMNSVICNIQQILNTAQGLNFNDYSYFDSTQEKGKENESITCPSQIYLFENNDVVAQKIREEFSNLQKKRKRRSIKNQRD